MAAAVFGNWLRRISIAEQSRDQREQRRREQAKTMTSARRSMNVDSCTLGVSGHTQPPSRTVLALSAPMTSAASEEISVLGLFARPDKISMPTGSGPGWEIARHLGSHNQTLPRFSLRY